MSTCFHCGDELPSKPISFQEKEFCCSGCKTVYELLSNSNLGSFYQFEKNAGVKPSSKSKDTFLFLEIPELQQKYIQYQDQHQIKTTLFLPSIHCSSCVYLLENLHKINPGVLGVLVHFTKREAAITFDPKRIQFSALASLLDRIGYTPNFGNKEEAQKKINKQFLYKLGVAGFGFGSIMLWSFPEYLGIATDNPEFRSFTSYLSLIFSIPVLVYSASEYYISAWKAIRTKTINLDVPITIGIIALYFESVWSILNADGPGYMDSFASFIFFLLIGKWFQNKTYASLSFERDYTSYFPVAVNRLNGNEKEIIAIEKIKPDDVIEIRNEEVIPCDSKLLSEEALIDYSFVTGESETIPKQKGDFIYAGGKVIGAKISITALKEAKRSQLTEIWNQTQQKSNQTEGSSYQEKLAHYFLWIILGIALISGTSWFLIDPSNVTNIVVSILIVACPCALALSTPFTYGNITRVLGRKGLYLKNALVIEQMNEITDVVFDKTGTLTTTENTTLSFLDPIQKKDVKVFGALADYSTHPVSKAIFEQLNPSIASIQLTDFREVKGQGIEATFEGKTYRIGSAQFCKQPSDPKVTSFLMIDREIWNRCIFKPSFREGIETLNQTLKHYHLHLISGDQNHDLPKIKSLLPDLREIHFNLSPQDKSNYIEQLQKSGKKVMMIGDGLNDAGALGLAHVGIAVSENIFRFTPASDAIVEAKSLSNLGNLLAIAQYSKKILKISLVFSLLYNLIGLSIAISGHLSPLVAAILMPISSITVVFLTTFLSLSKK